MRVYNDLAALTDRSSEFKTPYATIGVFDGVHTGHQSLIRELQEWAGDGGETVVITFREHPLAVLGHMPPSVITSVEHRLILLERTGVDAVVILDFDKEMAGWSPEEFVARVLVDGLGCRHFMLGFDANIGQGGVGDAVYLQGVPDLGVEVRRAQPFRIGGAVISSTEVRAAVMKGELYQVAQYLGRAPSLYGEVVHGDGRGRSLGFPTANLNLHHSAAPPHGVYMAEVLRIEGDKPACSEFSGTLGALINIGRRPTFLGPDVPEDYSRYFNEQLDKVEIYIHDFEGDLYGCYLETALHRKVRDERRFANVEELVAQIELDRDELVAWLANRA